MQDEKENQSTTHFTNDFILGRENRSQKGRSCYNFGQKWGSSCGGNSSDRIAPKKFLLEPSFLFSISTSSVHNDAPDRLNERFKISKSFKTIRKS